MLASRREPLLVRVELPDGREYEMEAEAASRAARVPGLQDILRGLTDSPKPSGESCPYCGWLDSEYRSLGYVGCPLCYSALASLRRT